jgi:pSer/pThr/pTyr-binding forkhead associated (FHA) protein
MILLESRGVKFQVQYQNGSGHEVELAGTVAILGRDPSCDLVLNDVKCSRRHAVVEAGPQGLAIRDTGSANGVYLNGKKVDRSPLAEGDVVRLGDVILTVLPEDMPGTLVMGPDEIEEATTPPPRPRAAAPPSASKPAPSTLRPSPAVRDRKTETVPRPLYSPLPPKPTAEPHRPLTLTVLAILWMLSVLLYPAAGLAVARTRGGVAAVLAVGVGVALAAVSAGMAYGLWTRRVWARAAQIAVAAVGLLLCPFSLASAAVLAYMLRPATSAHFSGGSTAQARPPDAAELTFTGVIMATVVLGAILAAAAVFFLRPATATLPR